jgi:cytochrome c oxidase cbb3-type subunit 3
VCHGSDAKGAKGFPNLTDKDWLWGGTPEAIEVSIMKGRNALMPNAKTNRLNTDADINNVANYVLKLSGQQADETAAAEGQKLFASVCVACHNPKGTGTAAMGAPNLTDNVWLYGGNLEAIKQTLANGRQGRMPAHGEFLGAAKVHLLATYVYSLSLDDATKSAAK